MIEIFDYCFYCKLRSKYICPKCKINYCSLKCYNNPDHKNCSETFYKKCVLEETNLNENEANMIFNYENMLSTELKNELGLDQDDTVEDEEDLHERMKDINLDDYEAVWSNLNDREKEQFQLALKKNEPWLINLLPKWEPWWCKKIPRKYFIDLKNNYEQIFVDPFNIPKLWKCKSYTSEKQLEDSISKASPSIINNIINLLFSYIYVTKLYNGAHTENFDETVEVLLMLSSPLNEINYNFQDPLFAIYDCFNKILELESHEIAPLGKPNESQLTKDAHQNTTSLLLTIDSTRNFYGNEKSTSFPPNSFLIEHNFPDLIAILSGPFAPLQEKITDISIKCTTTSFHNTLFIEAALSDIYGMLTSYAKKQSKSETVGATLNSESKIVSVEFSRGNPKILTSHGDKSLDTSEIKRRIKKMEFYIYWCRSFLSKNLELLSKSIAVLSIEFEHLKKTRSEENVLSQQLRQLLHQDSIKSKDNMKLIEEIS